MGLLDIFKTGEYKQKISELQSQVSEQYNEIEKLKSAFTPEQTNVLNLRKESETLNDYINQLTDEIEQKKKVLESLQSDISSRKNKIIELDDQILLQEFALYEPKYDFQSADEYKARLQDVRKNQKEMIRAGSATTGFTNWTVNGNEAQGRKMIKDMQKLLLRAFNSECDEVVDKVKYNTFDSAKKRITTSYEAISKLGAVMGISISEPYYNSKIDELTIALEYRIKKQEEKERQKELRGANARGSKIAKRN